MQFMDTHIHLQDFNANDTTDIIAAAAERGVVKLVCVSAREKDWDLVLDWAAKFPQTIIPALGLHPWYTAEALTGWEKRLEQKIVDHPQALIGECGLDRIHNPDYAAQKYFFDFQIELAKKWRRPLLIHAVKAAEWMEDFWDKLPEKFVFHAFGGRTEMLQKLLQYGGSAAFGWGIFKNRDGLEILRQIPAEHMLFETDSPYMAEKSGDENRPQSLPQIAKRIAEIRGQDLESLAEQVYQNSLQLTGIK